MCVQARTLSADVQAWYMYFPVYPRGQCRLQTELDLRGIQECELHKASHCTLPEKTRWNFPLHYYFLTRSLPLAFSIFRTEINLFRL